MLGFLVGSIRQGHIGAVSDKSRTLTSCEQSDGIELPVRDQPALQTDPLGDD